MWDYNIIKIDGFFYIKEALEAVHFVKSLLFKMQKHTCEYVTLQTQFNTHVHTH